MLLVFLLGVVSTLVVITLAVVVLVSLTPKPDQIVERIADLFGGPDQHWSLDPEDVKSETLKWLDTNLSVVKLSLTLVRYCSVNSYLWSLAALAIIKGEVITELRFRDFHVPDEYAIRL